MKKRISITISTSVLQEIDLQIGSSGSRSAFIEEVLSEHLHKLAWNKIGERDSILMNAAADYFNREMEDVLRYQADIFDILEDRASTQ